MIIVAARIDRNGAACSLLEDRQRIGIGSVIDSEHDDRAHIGPQHARLAAPLGIGHPSHVAMGAGGEKFPQARRRQRDGVGLNHAGHIEAVRACGRDQLRLKRGII